VANAGDGHPIATIQGYTAIFRPDDADADCRISLKFKRHNLVVTQTNRCDSGKYANVDGTYKKVSKWKLDPIPVILESDAERRNQIQIVIRCHTGNH
jgi:hypothetical protein